MSSLTPQSPEIKSFLPWLLGHPSCIAPAGTKEEIEHLLQNEPQRKVKNNIYEVGPWIFKTKRQSDAVNVNRLALCQQIRSYIEKNHLENFFIVPDKYLYWDESKKQLVVVVRKLDLSDEVAKPFSKQIENKLWLAGKNEPVGTQGHRLANGAKMREILPEQAEGLATFSFMGATDPTYGNLFFDKQGRIAIIDTETLEVPILEKLFSSPFSIFLRDRYTHEIISGLKGTSILKASCNQACLAIINKIERSKVMKATASVLAKIALTFFASLYLSSRSYSLLSSPIDTLNQKIILIFTLLVQGCFILKSVRLGWNLHLLHKVWRLSTSGDLLSGPSNILALEKKGYI